MIENEFKVSYTFNDEKHEDVGSCSLVAAEPVKPAIKIVKIGSPSDVKIGDVITYYVSVTIGDGDDLFADVLTYDTIDPSTDFVVGTLKLDGVVMESQDLTNIDLDLKPNTNYNLEYQCIRARL